MASIQQKLTPAAVAKYSKLYCESLGSATTFWLKHGFREGLFFPCLLADGSTWDDVHDASSTFRACYALTILHRQWPGDAPPPERDLLAVCGETFQGLQLPEMPAEGQLTHKQKVTLFVATCAYASFYTDSGRCHEWAKDAALQGAARLREMPVKNLLEASWRLDMELNVMEMTEVERDTRDGVACEFVERILDEYGDADDQVMYYHPQQGVSSFDYRLVSSGAAMQFLSAALGVAQTAGRRDLSERCMLLVVGVLQLCWDDELDGGLLLWRDSKGKPNMRLDWDRKCAWVHFEALCALISAFQQTGDVSVGYWWYKVHEYTWGHFHEEEGRSEFWANLTREGELLTGPFVGGPDKGFFHVPRALLHCTLSLRTLSQLMPESPEEREPGLIYEGALLKLGGFFKKTWTTRWGAVKNVDTIGKLIEWREKAESDYIHHWIPFDMLNDVTFPKEEGEHPYRMVLSTQWRTYAFAIPSHLDWDEWKEVLAECMKSPAIN